MLKHSNKVLLFFVKQFPIKQIKFCLASVTSVESEMTKILDSEENLKRNVLIQMAKSNAENGGLNLVL